MVKKFSSFWIKENALKGSLFERGQFFSPDLILAVVVFVGVMFLFYNTSYTIFSQVSLMESRKQLEENSHVALRSLVSTSGEPTDWEYRSLSDINSFGLVKEKGVLDSNKVTRFLSLLDSNYYYVKNLVGFGKYDFELDLTDSRGYVLASDGNIAIPSTLKFVYTRLLLYNNQPSTLRGVVSLVK